MKLGMSVFSCHNILFLKELLLYLPIVLFQEVLFLAPVSSIWNLSLVFWLKVILVFVIHIKLALFFSMFPKSTHETFANKLYQTFKVHKRFIKPKLSRTDFTIAHYAGEVWLLEHHKLYSLSSILRLIFSPSYFLFCRSCINLTNFWTRTKIMWFLNIRIC